MSDASETDIGLEAVKGLLAKLTQAALGFVGTIVFARILGPTSFGGFYFLLAITHMIDRPVRGVAPAVKKRFSEVSAPRRELVGLVIGLNLALVGLAAAVVLPTTVLGEQTNVPMAEFVFLAILASIIFFFPFQSMLQGTGRPGLTMWIDTVRSVLTLGLQLLLVARGLGAAGMGFGLAAATLLTLPITYYFLRVPPALPSRETAQSVWRFARYSIPETIVGKAYDRFDVLLLGALVGSAIVGQYEVAVKLTLPAMFLSGAITAGLMPKISGIDSKDEDPTQDAVNAVSYASALSIPIVFGALTLSERLVVTAYGAEYAPAAPFLIGLAVFRVLVTQTNVYKSVLRGIDEPRVTLKYSTITLGLNIILGAGLLFSIGPIGVVVATVVAEGARLVMFLRKAREYLPDLDPLPSPLIHQVLAGAVMSVVVFGAAEVVPLKSWLEVGTTIGFGGLVYGSVLLTISNHARVTAIEVWGQVAS